ncbi:endonuclease/exonuclease/phosphatase family protein [Mameliella sp. CS4]|uniref:endonuclease/exonuclease/phosphatase family protein n=1 Tax=Mameliella sp. CS4 TaxID=2862329 RepID=UPI001C5F4C42|nr:endonuclease/exonuclease/phosphatase family protein [Mameliella sp. CS4]MBW4984567.1 endonuclease/exonuclease/phosphatase family protein [Mameliella sp. CS4]
MVSLMRALVSIVAGFLVLAALATWGGVLHPAGDSLAVARLPLVALAALVVIWTGWARWLRWGLAGAALVVLGQAVVMKLATPSPGSFSVYQKNLLYRNAQIPELAADMLAQAPDVITLQELTSRNGDILDRLAPVYPHRATCPFYSWSRNAVLSRHPVLPGGTLCLPGQGVAGLHLDTPQGPVWVLSVHLRWPWPHPQAAQAAALEEVMAGLEGPVILSGDFNMMPWGHSVRRLTRAADVRRAGPLQPTYWLAPHGWPAGQALPIPLALDQVWAPGGGRAETRPLWGSDHAGVLARVHLDAD